MKQIVLASASPRRSELLKQIGLTFSVIPSDVEEDIDCNLAPEELAKGLAYKKALNVAEGMSNGRIDKNSLVIGADTIVVRNGVLGKPKDEEQAYNMLKSLQDGWHEVITGISVIDISDFTAVKASEKTRVRIRKLSDELIYSYIKTGEPMDKAGAYGIQGIGAILVEKIEGCYFNVVGLPLAKLNSILEKFGVRAL